MPSVSRDEVDVGSRLDNEHRERGENAGDRGDSHPHVESREQDAAQQGDGINSTSSRPSLNRRHLGNSCVDVNDPRDQPDCKGNVGRDDRHDLKGDDDPRGAQNRAPPPSPHGRTRMIVFPLRRSVALNVAMASSRVETVPMFVRSRPSRTRWTISPS
jgi:hypothetical protein